MITTSPVHTDALAWLVDAGIARADAGLHREPYVRDSAAPLINLASNDYLGLASQQHILDGDLLPVQSLLLETTLKHGCVAQLDLLAEQQPSAPLQRAPRCGQSI